MKSNMFCKKGRLKQRPHRRNEIKRLSFVESGHKRTGLCDAMQHISLASSRAVFFVLFFSVFFFFLTIQEKYTQWSQVPDNTICTIMKYGETFYSRHTALNSQTLFSVNHLRKLCILQI